MRPAANVTPKSEIGGAAASEDMMIWKFPVASKAAVLLGAIAVVAVGSMTSADAQPRRQYDDRGRPYYGPSGPNASYQQ